MITITGTHANFTAMAFVAQEVRAGRLPDTDRSIEEVERLYAESLIPPPTSKQRWRGQIVVANAIVYTPRGNDRQ